MSECIRCQRREHVHRIARKAIRLCGVLLATACSIVGAVVIGRVLGNCIADLLQW